MTAFPRSTLALPGLLRSAQAATIATRGMAMNSKAYCMDLVKRRDYEHYLTTLLLPRRVRRAVFAIRAFNVEVSSVREAVSGAATGALRMQFWRDSIDKIFAAKNDELSHMTQQPVVRELQGAVISHDLSADLFRRVISSRQSALGDKPFASLDELNQYSQDAFSSINFLILECLRERKTPQDDKNSLGHARHAANHLGQAEGTITLLRAIPFNAAKRRVLLPTDLMASRRVSAESVIRAKVGDEFREIVEIIAHQAEQHLENARFRQKYLSNDEKSVMLPAVVVDAFLTLLHKTGCNVFDGQLQRRNPWLPLSLYLKSLRHSY